MGPQGRRPSITTHAGQAAMKNECLQLFTAFDDAVCVTDDELRVVLWNSAAAALYGVDAAHAEGRPVDELFRIEGAVSLQGEIERLTAAGGAFHGEVVHLVPSDRRVVVDWTVRRLDLENIQLHGWLLVARDVTERRRMFEQMAREKDLSDAIIDSLPGMFFVVDSHFRLLRWNENYRRVTGLPERELPGREVLTGVVVEDRAAALERIRQVVRDGYAAGEARIVSRQGEVLHYHFSGVRVQRGDDMVLVGVGIDISDRKRAEQAQRESETRLRAIFEATQDAIGVARQGVQVFGNRALMDMFGYDNQDDLIGHPITDLIAPAERERIIAYTRSRESGATVPLVYETRGLRKDGSEFDMEVLGSTYDLDGQVHTLVILRDITARKRSERALRDSEARLRTVIEHAHEGIVMADATGAIIAWNREQERLTGVPASEALGKPVWEVIFELVRDQNYSAERYARIKADMQAFFRTGEAPWAEKLIERDMVTRDGRRIALLGRSSVIRTDDGFIFLRTTQDITERRDMERERERMSTQLRQAQKMESIGRLAGGVAHDFNNLLTSIAGNVELARLELTPGDPRDMALEPRLVEIEQAAQSAASLTRQLLAFSRKQIIEPRITDLNELIERMHKMLIRVIGEDIELRTLPGRDLGIVRVDRSQIEQIIINLAVNARDAMPDGGQLTIETANTTLDEDFCQKHPPARPGSYVMLTVTDTGCGMSPEVLEHAFEPFFTTKETGKGTGLGLATVYGATQQNNGFIHVYSEVGKGTSFKVFLPRIQESLSGTRQLPPVPLPRGTETIMLVEDDAFVRKVAVDILRRLGYRVLAYADGMQALESVQREQERIDLLMTDVVMPGMNGKLLAQHVKALRSDIKVLFTSGYTEDAIVHRGALDDGIEFIAKPYSVESLSKKIRAILDG